MSSFVVASVWQMFLYLSNRVESRSSHPKIEIRRAVFNGGVTSFFISSQFCFFFLNNDKINGSNT